MTTFTRNDKFNNSGSHLQFRLPDLTEKQVVGLFGRASPGYDDPDKGYGSKYVFVRDDLPNHPVTLYDRWGMWRVGALERDDAEEFVAWLSAKLGAVTLDVESAPVY